MREGTEIRPGFKQKSRLAAATGGTAVYDT